MGAEFSNKIPLEISEQDGILRSWSSKSLSKHIKKKGITSIAFPLLGTHNGGLDKIDVLNIMHFYLDKCSIPIEIYEYDSKAPDELYKQFKDKWMSMSIYDKKNLGIRANQIVVIDKILNDINNSSMTSLSECNGIGIVTLQKCFNLILNYKEQPMLDWK